jgi:hypothetical protein
VINAFCNTSSTTITSTFVITSVTLYAPVQNGNVLGAPQDGDPIPTVNAEFIVVENHNLSTPTHTSSVLTIQQYGNFFGDNMPQYGLQYPQTYSVNMTIPPGSYYFGWNVLYNGTMAYMTNSGSYTGDWTGSVSGNYVFV